MLTFLKEACSGPWETMDLGGVETIDGKVRAIRCNHVYVGCQTPFLIAAEPIDSSTGTEIFGVVVLQDSDSIRKFTEGPYPPHNRPAVLSLQQLVGKPSEAYLRGHKEASINKISIVDVDGSRLSIDQGLIIEGDSLCVRISADDEVPMALLVCW